MADADRGLAAVLETLRSVYEEKLTFNRLLGLQIELGGLEDVRVRFPMREDLVGNYLQGSLHGGVVSAVLDVAGALVATLETLRSMANATLEEIVERVGRIGTVDLRVDFLRPGRGRIFTATGAVLRIGQKVAVARTELRNEEDVLIAVGTGTYLIV